jgi:hypothetical protein
MSGLAFSDEVPRSCEIPAGDGDKGGIAGISHGLPVFAGDEGSTQDAPATGGFGHELRKTQDESSCKDARHFDETLLI